MHLIRLGLITLLLSSAFCAQAMEDFYEQFKEAQSTESLFKETYAYLHETKGFAQAQILEMTEQAPALIALAIKDCSTTGKLSPLTLKKLLTYIPKISRSSQEAVKLEAILTEQTKQCGKLEVILLKAKAHDLALFNEFVQRKGP